MKITLASKITIARIFLIFPCMAVFILAFVLNSSAYIPCLAVSCFLFVLLSATDFVDGAIARKTNTVTEFGKFLDPLADKIIVVVMLFLIVYFDDIRLFQFDSLVLAILSGFILSRELIIGVFRALAASKGLVLAADVFGKIKTVFLDIGVAVLILAGIHPVFAYAGTITFYIGAFFAIYSGFNYMIKNKSVFSDMKSEDSKDTDTEKLD